MYININRNTYQNTMGHQGEYDEGELQWRSMQ